MATVTAIAVDYQENILLRAFSSDVKKALQSDLPFIKQATLSGLVASLVIDKSATKMDIRQYRGAYQGNEVIARIGYVVKNKIGYALVGVFAKNDLLMEKTVNKVMGSFNVSES